jgi:hypothetical protein
MKTTIKALRRRSIDRLIIESVDLSLYIAHAEIDGQRWLLTDNAGKILTTRNLLDMKTALVDLKAKERILTQRSAYDEMVGQGFAPAEEALEVPLGPGFETLPPWQH